MSPRRVLVVEDDRAGAHCLALILRLEGYETRVAVDVASALEEVRRFRPEAILSDIGLPGTDGLELARRIRGDCELSAGIKLMVALTGRSGPEARARSLKAGFDEHFMKPVDPETILAVLAALEWREPKVSTPDPAAAEPAEPAGVSFSPPRFVGS